ncbi:MAG: flippase-like domain-containing protein [Gemmatimonadetes bacterium]|nr:flippase-like domain-containing protein [Gemmatimonadota bacterium]
MTASRGTRRIMAIAFLAVALIFVVVLLRGQWTSLDEVMASTRAYHWSLRPWLLALAVLIGVVDLLLMGSVWARLFRRTGGDARLVDAVRVWVVTNFGRYIPGKVWQLGGLAAYMKGTGDSGAAALVSALAFQVIALATGAAVALSTLGVAWAGANGNGLPALVTLAAILLIGLRPRVIHWTAGHIGRWLGESDLTLDLDAGDIARAVAGMLFAWILYGVGFLVLLKGVGIAAEISQLPVVTGIFAASYVVGYLVLLAPGGLVVREGAMTGLLVELLGLALGVAAAVAIMARIWVLVTELVALALVLAWRKSVAEEEKLV